MVMQLPQGPTVYGGAQSFAGPGVAGLRAVASFGVDSNRFSSEFNAHAVVNSERYKELEFRERFYKCTQHDWKFYDFNGNFIQAGEPWQRGPTISVNKPAFEPPLDQRRPCAPYRLARVIVKSFTKMVFGHGRWPAIKVVGDPVSQDFAEALVKASKLPSVMVRARNIGGSVGTVGLSWRFYEGKPRVLAHSGKHLFVHSWIDREEGIPEHVSELYQTARDEWNPQKKRIDRVWYWHRRDWTPMADIGFFEVKVTSENPIWQVDQEQTNEHGDGFCHFVWVQNQPDDDLTEIDGAPDYDGIYENCNELDVLNSVVSRGGKLNLDPTLVLMTNRAPSQVRTGSSHTITPGIGGDAKYMELAGSSIEAGLKLCDKERNQALEVSQCVIADPNEVAAAGTSSVALKMIYAPMLGTCDVLRTQYGQAIERLLEQMIKSARRHLPEIDDNGDEVYEIELDEEGQEVTVEKFLDLPPRVVTEDVFDEAGNATGETTTRLEKRRPGEGGDVELEWGDYFEPTEEDRSKKATTLTSANGGKPVISHKSSVESYAVAEGLDPVEEWSAVTKQLQAQAKAQQGMFLPTGGPVDAEGDLPDGAPNDGELPDVREESKEPEPEPEKPEPPEEKEVPIEKQFAVITVNEYRKRCKLDPWPNADEGLMTVNAFDALQKARAGEAGKAVGAAVGKVEAQALAPSPPEPAGPPPGSPAGAPPAPGGAVPPPAPPAIPGGTEGPGGGIIPGG